MYFIPFTGLPLDLINQKTNYFTEIFCVLAVKPSLKMFFVDCFVFTILIGKAPV